VFRFRIYLFFLGLFHFLDFALTYYLFWFVGAGERSYVFRILLFNPYLFAAYALVSFVFIASAMWFIWRYPYIMCRGGWCFKICKGVSTAGLMVVLCLRFTAAFHNTLLLFGIDSPLDDIYAVIVNRF